MNKKFGQRLTSIALVVFMIMTMLPFAALPVSAAPQAGDLGSGGGDPVPGGEKYEYTFYKGDFPATIKIDTFEYDGTPEPTLFPSTANGGGSVNVISTEASTSTLFSVAYFNSATSKFDTNIDDSEKTIDAASGTDTTTNKPYVELLVTPGTTLGTATLTFTITSSTGKVYLIYVYLHHKNPQLAGRLALTALPVPAGNAYGTDATEFTLAKITSSANVTPTANKLYYAISDDDPFDSVKPTTATTFADSPLVPASGTLTWVEVPYNSGNYNAKFVVEGVTGTNYVAFVEMGAVTAGSNQAAKVVNYTSLEITSDMLRSGAGTPPGYKYISGDADETAAKTTLNDGTQAKPFRVDLSENKDLVLELDYGKTGVGDKAYNVANVAVNVVASGGSTSSLAASHYSTSMSHTTFTLFHSYLKTLEDDGGVLLELTFTGDGYSALTTLTVPLYIVVGNSSPPKASKLSASFLDFKPAAPTEDVGSSTVDLTTPSGSKYYYSIDASTALPVPVLRGMTHLLHAGIIFIPFPDGTASSSSGKLSYTIGGLGGANVGKYITLYVVNSTTGIIEEYASREITADMLRNEQDDPDYTYAHATGGGITGGSVTDDGLTAATAIHYDLKSNNHLTITLDYGETGEGEYKYDGADVKLMDTFTTPGTPAEVTTGVSSNKKSTTFVIKSSYLRTLKPSVTPYIFTLKFAAAGTPGGTPAPAPTVAAADLPEVDIYILVEDSARYKIEGKLVDKNNKPAAGIQIKLLDSVGAEIKDSTPAAITATSNLKGLFTLSDIPASVDGERYVLSILSSNSYESMIVTIPALNDNMDLGKIDASGATVSTGGISPITLVDAPLGPPVLIPTYTGPNSDPAAADHDSDLLDFIEAKTLKIDLMQEEEVIIGLPDTFEVKSYSIDGGRKWKDLKGKAFDYKIFSKILSKASVLVVANANVDKATKRPGNQTDENGDEKTGTNGPVAADILNFGAIKARPKLPAFSANYMAVPVFEIDSNNAIKRDADGNPIPEIDNAGNIIYDENKWTLTAKNSTKALVQLSYAEPSEQDAKSPGLFKSLPDTGLDISTDVGSKEMYFVRTEPVGNTPASKIRKVTVSGYTKAPAFRLKDDGTVKIKVDMYIDDGTGGGGYELYKKGSTYTAPTSGSNTIKAYAASSQKKPRSVLIEIQP